MAWHFEVHSAVSHQVVYAAISPWCTLPTVLAFVDIAIILSPLFVYMSQEFLVVLQYFFIKLLSFRLTLTQVAHTHINSEGRLVLQWIYMCWVLLIYDAHKQLKQCLIS